uniref:Cytoplasmic linker associated protein 2 n=1 Tax=Astyanax mexicanus TaxID=7994 RepID=A0A8B9KXE0_ASTMX
MEENDNMDYFYQQVLQKDVSRRLQVGPDLIDYLSDPQRSADVDQDKSRLDKTIDELTGWVNSSNFKVGTHLAKLSYIFISFVYLVPALVDRLGDGKDQVRDQAQALILKLMEQAATPMYVWERLFPGFKHKNFRSREGLCLCLVATLNAYGAQPLSLSKFVPHLCTLTGDQNPQVRESAISALVEVYRHVGERVRADLSKRGLPAARLQTILSRFDEVLNSGNMALSLSQDRSFDDDDSVDGSRPSSAQATFRVPKVPKKPADSASSSRRPSATGAAKTGGSKEGAGAVDEEDFIKAFTDVPTVQIYSTRDLEDNLNKIREICSDDKHDWDQRANAMKKIRSLLVAGANNYDCFFQHLRLLDGAFKLSAKDLRSQVVREACITVAHLSTVLGNKFDHGAEAIVPVLFNLIPNCAKVMASSGTAAIRIIIRHTHVPRLIPLITGNCTSKSVSVRRRCYEFLDLLLQEWQTHSLERHAAVLVDSIKKGIRDADSEARVEARKTYWGLRAHFPVEAESLYNSLESSYQRTLQSCLKSSGSVASLPQSDRSSSSSQESLNRPLSSKWSAAPGRVPASSKSSGSPGSLQRSRSDVDVNAAAGAKARHSGQTGGAGRLTTALPPGSCASLGRLRTKQPLSTPSGVGSSQVDSRGRSRTKMVSQSQPGSRSGSPGRVLASTALSTLSTGAQRVSAAPGSHRRSRIPRSQGCSRDSSPTRLSVGKHQSHSLFSHSPATFSWSSLGLCPCSRLLGPCPVFSMFLETLVDFIMVHKEDLQDWLFVLLTQLLKKMGADLLGSVQAKVQKALDVTRESFPNDLQFTILMRFTVDQTQTPNLKVKVAILKYIETLTLQMEPQDFVNSSETRLAVSRIITWTTEPKTVFKLKTKTSTFFFFFTHSIPYDMPLKLSIQTWKCLCATVGSPLTRHTQRSPASWSSPLTSPTSTSQNAPSPNAFDYDTENMNSEEIYSSLRGVSQAIQNFSVRSQEDMTEPPRKREGDGGEEGGTDATDSGRTALDNKTSLLNTMPLLSSSPRPTREYQPGGYSDSSFGSSPFSKSMKDALDQDAESLTDDSGVDQSEVVAELLKELSNHSERVEERKAALCELMRLIRETQLHVWDEHFKTILLLLLETLGDGEHVIRALALRVLKEILNRQPWRFKNYAELTIMKTLEAHKDPHKEVVRAAEEAAAMLASSISPEQCIKVLCPIIQSADYPINLAAIKMLTKVIERLSKDGLLQMLPEIVPGLIQGYDNSESSVRKACVFCLVAIYAIIGEDLKPHLSQLSGSKLKLLNLYIKRAQSGSSGSDPSDMGGQGL